MPLSFLMFEGITELDEAKIQLPMLIFQVEMLGLSSISTLFFRRWVDAGERRKELAQQPDTTGLGQGTASPKRDTSRSNQPDIPV